MSQELTPFITSLNFDVSIFSQETIPLKPHPDMQKFFSQTESFFKREKAFFAKSNEFQKNYNLDLTRLLAEIILSVVVARHVYADLLAKVKNDPESGQVVRHTLVDLWGHTEAVAAAVETLYNEINSAEAPSDSYLNGRLNVVRRASQDQLTDLMAYLAKTDRVGPLVSLIEFALSLIADAKYKSLISQAGKHLESL